MDFVNSLREYSIFTQCLLPAWEFVEEEFSEVAPIEVGRWTWRSAVVIVGIGTSFATFLCAAFELTSMITTLALATTAILCFALYYVSRFEEQRRMSLLLDDLEGQVEVLEEANANYAANNDRFEKTEQDLRGEVTTLTETNEDLTENLNLTSISLQQAETLNGGLTTNLKRAQTLREQVEDDHAKYVAANEDFAEEIAKRLTLMDQREEKCREKQVDLDQLAARMTTDTVALAKIAGEVRALEEVREAIKVEVAELREQVAVFKQGLTTGAGQQDQLQGLLARLEQLSILTTTIAKPQQLQTVVVTM